VRRNPFSTSAEEGAPALLVNFFIQREGRMKLSRLSWLLLAVCACGGGGNGGTGTTGPTGPTGPAPSSASFTMAAETFSPTQVTIARNGTVTWNNTSGVVHNVTFDATTGAPANIPDHSSGSNQRTFSVSGTFPFQCTLHAGMTGQVGVQ
jgi:plastocyanin